jgi:CRP-like cAMP-binding protein
MTLAIPLLKNRLLAALSAEDFARLSTWLTVVELEKGRVLYERGDTMDIVYLPNECVISLMTPMAGGQMVESATIGCEGALGLTSGGPRYATANAVVQMGGRAARIAAVRLADAAGHSASLRAQIETQDDALLGQSLQSAACNALHSVSARFSRWLLACRDRTGSDSVPLTQDSVAAMLGVQRTTVTAVAGDMQARGLIRYRRGVVDILDRPGLETAACECYEAVKRLYQRTAGPIDEAC